MCVSHYVRNELINAGQLSERAGVIYNGLDPSDWLRHARHVDAQQRDPLRLVYTGSLDQIKGVHTAIEAMGHPETARPGRSAGSDHYRQRPPWLRGAPTWMVDQFALHDRVHFAGRIARDAMPVTLPEYDVFLSHHVGLKRWRAQ